MSARTPMLSEISIRLCRRYLESMPLDRVVAAMAEGCRHGWAAKVLRGQDARARVTKPKAATQTVRFTDGVQDLPAMEVDVRVEAVGRRRGKAMRVRAYTLDAQTIRVHAMSLGES